MNEILNTDSVSFSDAAYALRAALDAFGTRPVVVLCIGSDRVLFDSAGPLVGTLLSTRLQLPAFVYGTLDYPIHALNLSAALAHIKRRHPTERVLCVDACLGAAADVGKLGIRRGGVLAGTASGKRLPPAGDVGLTLTVATRVKQGADARLSLVYALSNKAARLIAQAIGKQFPINNIVQTGDKHIKPTLKFD